MVSLLACAATDGAVHESVGHETGFVDTPPAVFHGDLMFDDSAIATDLSIFCEEYGSIDGSVWVGDTAWPDLAGLECLTEVGGDFHIERNQNMTSLAGLNQLRAVGGLLVIKENQALNLESSLDALEQAGGIYLAELPTTSHLGGWPALTMVSGNIELLDLPVLDGLVGITHVGGDVVVRRSSAKTFESLNSVVSAGSITFMDNAVLEQLDGLSSLTDVDGGVNLFDTSLAAFGGLGKLERVGSLNLSFSESAGVDGFAAVRDVRGDLDLVYNAQLVQLGGLSGVEHILGTLRIFGNDKLPSEEISTLVAAIGEANIEGGVETTESCVAPCF